MLVEPNAGSETSHAFQPRAAGRILAMLVVVGPEGGWSAEEISGGRILADR